MAYLTPEQLEKFKNQIKHVIEQLPELKENMNSAEDWNELNDWLRNFAMAFHLVSDLCEIALEIISEMWPLTEAEQDDMIVKALDDLITLPFVLEPFDGMAIRYIVTSVRKMFKTKGYIPRDIKRQVAIQEAISMYKGEIKNE
jgi:hypothetical protein